MNKVLVGLIIALSVSLVTAASLEGYDYFVTDKVSGRNLELVEFDDDLGIIDKLLYEEMVRRSVNKFSGEFSIGIPTDTSKDFEFTAEDLNFNGRISFDGGSYMVYSLEDFELEETNIDEYGITEVFGKGVLVFEQKVIVEKEVPVEVNIILYSDEEDKESFEQEIYLTSLTDERLHVSFINNPEDKNTFKHKRECFGDCFDEGPYDWTIVYTNENGTVPLSEQD